MRRVWRVSELHKFRKPPPYIPYTDKIIVKSAALFPVSDIREHTSQTFKIDESNGKTFTDIISLFSEKCNNHYLDTVFKAKLERRVSELKDQILLQNDDAAKIQKVLEENGVPVFRIYADGSAVLELLKQLKPHPYLAMEVLNWRRVQLDYTAPMTSEEFAIGIAISGRLKNVELATELFNDASNRQLKSTSLFNALMSAYSCNGLIVKCQKLFQELKMDSTCSPSITSYNILISSFGRMMLIDHMEATFREVNELSLTPTLDTYKGLIGGYVTAWAWEKMEKTYLTMKANSVKPDMRVHMLMLRGYAHSGQLEKMEEIYEMVRGQVDHNKVDLFASMISAYCRSSDRARVEKVEKLMKEIPENWYRPWLNVTLICLYAKEDLLERMEASINEAFEQKTYVTTAGVMRCIISAYFRHNAVDKLADFVRRAELSRWKMCRSLYHCKMVMYASQMRLTEMERVLDEMYRINMPSTRKTFWILCCAYRKCGQRSKLEQVIGMMWKTGFYKTELDVCNS